MASFWTRVAETFGTKAVDNSVVDPGGQQFEGSIMKSFIPNHLYKPAFGYPRGDDVMLLRQLAKNAYVHSVIATIQHEVASADWDIVVKDGEEDTEGEEDGRRNILKWFNNPNGNSESFSWLLRAVVRDVLEIEAGIWVKVFDGNGNFKQVFARDGATFLKNPDVHGYLGDREDIIQSYYYEYDQETNTYRFVQKYENQDDLVFVKDKAAYWQYGWTAATMPVPFGKREIIWFEANPQTNSIYGRSPLSVLGDVLYTLLYGASFNLDMYLNNNIPDGVIQLIGASRDDIRAFRERWEAQFMEKDVFENKRKKFFTFPITNTDAKFTPFVFSSKEMEVLEQQKWFWKLVMACFGVTPSEMGFTEDSNRATEMVQSAVFKRKAVGPLLDILEYHINLQIMPELDPSGKFEFRFVRQDLDEELKKYQLYQLQIQTGIKTAEMIAEDEGVDVEELKRQKQENMEAQQAMMNEANTAAEKQEEPEAKSAGMAPREEEFPDMDSYFAKATRELNDLIKTLGGPDE